MAGYHPASGSTSAAWGANATASAGQQYQQQNDEDNLITVAWGGERMRFQLPPPDAPLSTLRRLIQERTGVPPEHQKLILGGAVMQKDLPLKTYGLVKPSLRDDVDGESSGGWKGLMSKWGLSSSSKPRELKITMIGSKHTQATVSDRLPSRSAESQQRQQQQSAPPPPAALDEPRVIAQIDSLVKSTIEKVEPSLETLNTVPASPEEKAKQKQNHLYLSEMLLQALLKLDGFEVDSKWTQARSARKEGIKKVQSILDRVDAAKDAALANQ